MTDDEKKALLATLDAMMIFISDANTMDHYSSQKAAQAKLDKLKKALKS